MDDIPHVFGMQWQMCLLKARYAGPFPVTEHRAGRRDHWTYMAVKSGSMQIRTFGLKLFLPRGGHAILPPYRNAEFLSADPKQAVVALQVGFNVDPFLGSGNPLVRLGLPVVLPQPARPDWHGWCDSITRCFRDYKAINEAATIEARGLLDLLLGAYLTQGFQANAFESAPRNAPPTWLRELADVITKRCPKADLHPRELHRLSGYSRSRVGEAFRQHFGETPRQFLHRRRILLAMERLTGNPEMSIGEVAEACGYSTQPLFNRHFRIRTGMTPTKFRTAHATGGTGRSNRGRPKQ